jgi:hypothetical protein
MSSVWNILSQCETAVANKLTTFRSSNDKEFHFQNWVYDRILDAGYTSSAVGRNTYPDFPIDNELEAYEVKGITAGSREKDFDSNSALPSGEHAGKRVYYVFGRYENVVQGAETPRVLDLVLVDGAFINVGSPFIASNKSLRVLGSFGDILLRDRKMYAPYTPYKWLTGLRDSVTLITRAGEKPSIAEYHEVGRFERVESEKVLVGYRADLRANTLIGEFEDNPNGGKSHEFVAYRSVQASTKDSVEWIHE